MKSISALGWWYAAFGTATCVYLCAAAIGGWSGPVFDTGSSYGQSGSSYGPVYSSGSYGGRSSGGFGGGGK